MRHGRTPAGFTMIELIVVIAIVAILAMVAIPALQNSTLGSRLTGYANSMTSSVAVARSEALKRNLAAQLCMSSDGTNCASTGDWSQGWIVRALNSGGTYDVLQYQQALPSGFKLTDSGGATTLTFPASGSGVTAATFTLCRANPLGSQERTIVINSLGRAAVTRTATGSC